MLAEVKHQPEAVKFLRCFVEGSLTSPLLLLGPEGVGRRFSVLQAVQEAFCTGTRETECPCANCYQIAHGIHPDLIVLDAVEKDIGVDAVRTMIQEAGTYPASADSRCFVIDGADRFTVQAANAFLKTLEDPPARSRFFLIAENAGFVLPTIRSRCGAVRCGVLPDSFVLSVLHRYEKDDAKALVYGRMGEGSVGSAIRFWGSGKLSLRDHVIKVVQVALDKDLPAVFSSVDAMKDDSLLALRFLDQVVHDVLIVQVDPMRAIHRDIVETLQTMSSRVSLATWMRFGDRVRSLRDRTRKTSLHIPFHLKTLLAETFV